MNATDPKSNWRTAKQFSIDDYGIEEGIDYHTLSWFNRSIDLDTVIDSERVVTGVRFRVIDSHLRLEVRVTNFDFESGKLVDIPYSAWIYNNATRKIQLELQNPDRPTRTRFKSIPVRGKNHYVNFQPSSIEKDAAQSTVPFIDKTGVEAMTPLAGVGIYLKTYKHNNKYGYGGFIAPRLVVFDSALYMQTINNFK